jgi:hypothetical protein
MGPKRLRGYIRLACAVTGRSVAQTRRLTSQQNTGGLYEVKLPNRHYTGPLLGKWFENGAAQVGEEASERFRARGYAVRKLE